MSEPIANPWVIAKATPRNLYRERLMVCRNWGTMQHVWRDRRAANRWAAEMSLFYREGCFYRAVPMPITGTM